MPKPAASKRSRVKSPFALHSAVTARSNLPTQRARELVLSPDGAHALLSDSFKARVYDTLNGTLALQGTPLDGSAAEHVAWSPRGDVVATLRREEGGATVSLWSFPTGALLHEASLKDLGTFTSGMPGVAAAVMVFRDDGEVLWVRSVPNISVRESYVWRVEVRTGGADCAKLPLSDLVTAIAPFEGDVIFATMNGRWGRKLIAWRFGDPVHLAALTDASGLDLARVGDRVWVAGDTRWAFTFDARALVSGTLRPSPEKALLERERRIAQPLRDARIDELALRAKGRWYVDHFKWLRGVERDIVRDELTDGSIQSSQEVRAWLHTEPNAVAQCVRLGDGVVVRDGVTLSAWRLDGEAFRELRLAEDLQKSAPSGSRMTCVAAAGNVVAVVWDKSIGGGTSLVSVMEVDLAATGLA